MKRADSQGELVRAQCGAGEKEAEREGEGKRERKREKERERERVHNSQHSRTAGASLSSRV